MTAPVTTDDVAVDARAASRSSRPPLIILDAVTAFLDARGLGRGSVAAEPIGDGHSNVTFRLVRDDATFVLRRPPRPPLPPSTHDVLRESRILQALRPAGVRVPKVLACCEDTTVIGMPFYVMSYIDGVVPGERLPDAFDTEAGRAHLTEGLIGALADLHAVDHEAVGLGGLGRPTGYLERQIRRFSSIWQEVRTRDLPEVERVAAWLAAHLPPTARTCIVHGDFRLGNVIVDRGRPEVVAILDWEMATVGDPLADLGYLCATWARSDEEENPVTRLSSVTRRPGFPSRDDLRELYARATGTDVNGLRFYEVLALFKATVFLESSYRRFREGRTQDPYFAQLADGVPQLARAAWQRTRKLT